MFRDHNPAPHTANSPDHVLIIEVGDKEKYTVHEVVNKCRVEGLTTDTVDDEIFWLVFAEESSELYALTSEALYMEFKKTS